MLRSVLAVLSAPIVYGIVCVPVNWLIVSLFPSQFDEDWVTQNTSLLVLLVSLTLVFAAVSGFVGAAIARGKVWRHVAAMCALLLAVGIAVQSQFWDALPVWYHLSFFGLLLAGVPLGAWLKNLAMH